MSADVYAVAPLTRPPDAVITVPGSKSLTNRALLVAALAEGTSVLEGILWSDDTRYMSEALQALGAGVRIDADAARATVAGCAGRWPATAADLYVGNAGTAMRFLTAAACLGAGHYRLDGTPRMRQRPIGELVAALRALGAAVEATGDCPPVAIEAAGLRGGPVRISGARSSQFVSALLLAAPYAASDVRLELDGPVVAPPYVDMTVAVMTAFGATVEQPAAGRFVVRTGRPYRARRYAIEPDASSAHYFWAAAALTGGRVRVEGLGRASLQGDVRFAEVLARMGADVRWEADAIEVRGAGLRGIDVDLSAISDTALTVMALAPFADGPTRVRNVAHIRLQESDRLAAAVTELRRLGVAVVEHPDGVEIRPGPVHSATVDTYDDHRVAMAFALVGLRAPGVAVRDPGCVAKTFPDFFARLEALRR